MLRSDALAMDDEAAGEVVAMQFAGGMSIARLAEEWERDAAWVEAAIRRALLATIPQRDGGLKVSRAEARHCMRQTLLTQEDAQGELVWPE